MQPETTVNGDKHPPAMEPETLADAEEDDVEEDRTFLLRKTFRQRAQSSISSTDSDEMFNGDSKGLKFVIRDERKQEQGTGYSNGSSRSEINGDHRVIYEAIPTNVIEVVTTRNTGAQNGTAIKFQRDQIPLAVANPASKGPIEDQASYYTSLDNGTAGYKRVELRTENGTEVADLYLERIYEKPGSHNFYCPNCQACITKVIIREREWVNNTVSKRIPTQVDKFRCTSCLSFLTPIGEWLFPKLVSPDPEEDVSFRLGNNVESTGIREREAFQVLQETRDHQENQVDGAPVPNQSVDYAAPNKNEGNNVENIGIEETETIQVLQERREHQESQVDGAPLPNQSVDYAVTDTNEVVPDQSVDNAVADQTQKTVCPVSNTEQTQKIDCVVSNTTETQPSLSTSIAKERVVPDKGVNSNQGNVIEIIKVGRPDSKQELAETIYDHGIQAASKNKTQVPDKLDVFDMWINDEVPDTGADSTIDSRVLVGAKDSKKGSTVENMVVGIPYTSNESNGSVLDVDNQTSTVNKPQVQNQSNGFAVLLEPEIDTKANLTPGLTSLEAMMPETVTVTLDGKKGIDVENVVVGIPHPSPEPKGELLDRFSLPTLINKVSIPDQSAGVAKTEILKLPETVEATVPNSSPVSPSLGPPTAGRVLDSAVGYREVEAGPEAIRINVPLDDQVEPEPSTFNRLEIVKSIVYGGLAESITSLGIVASAASANTKTGNIVVLALANLFSGLFILGHNLTGLKSEQFRRTSNETDNHEHVDRYEVVLGNRDNYILHFTLAIFSFVLFGLVPPLVYGFSFTKSNDPDFKLAAVAGASLLCIILLAIGKAYIQRPNRWEACVKTVATYVVIAAGAGGFSYLAGNLLDRLIKKYGWFEQGPTFNMGLPLPEMSLAKPAWGSF